MHWESLDTQRQQLLPHLSFLKSFGFYLAGGTALALQIGHRTSIDFDFYTETPFNEQSFENAAVKNLPLLKVTQRAYGTLIGQIGRVDLSFFHYPYPHVQPLISSEYFEMSSIADIAAMKLIAISQRGLRRDFIDMYVIAKQYSLQQVFLWTRKKFSQFDPHVCLKALTYFDDAEKDESGRGTELKEKISWTTIKSFFEKESVRLAKQWL